MLNSVRKAYLSTAPAPLRRHDRPPSARLNGAEGDEDDLEKWRESKYLSDREKDEIDLRGKMILRRCRERVGVLEESEKGGSFSHPSSCWSGRIHCFYQHFNQESCTGDRS